MRAVPAASAGAANVVPPSLTIAPMRVEEPTAPAASNAMTLTLGELTPEVAPPSPVGGSVHPFLASGGVSAFSPQGRDDVVGARNPRVDVQRQLSPAAPKRERAASGWWPAVKRFLDVAIAAPLLVVFSPLIVGLWLAVRSTSRGPGLFWSTRVGRDGRLFSMPKLRSMRLGAPLQAREAFAVGQDPATPLGRFIRAYSLDELPQLWCVLIGQMSLIGPRPLLPDDPGALERLQFPASMTVRPGVTGLAQVSGRNFVTPRRKARYDAFYAKRLTAKLDAAILWRTIVALFFRRGGGVL